MPEKWKRSIILPPFQGVTCLTVASPSKHKNFGIIVDIIRYLRKTYPNFKVRFVLTCKYEQWPLADDVMESVVYVGKTDVSECPHLYNQADIMFMPTLLECFSATYPEAMRMGVPIVTTDLEFARGLCGDAACYYSAIEAEAAAEAIYKVSCDKEYAKRLVDNGKEQLKSFDNYEQRTKKLVKILEDISMYKNCFKRVFDFCIALVALLLIGWFLIIIAIWLHFVNKGAGAFFFQERPGKNAKIFKVIKFKTMTDERDAEGNLLPDEKRLTKVGKFVRSTSIDELPQLINVLKGDMALIGPRPLLIQYLPLYSPEQARRHEVRPGISGWAQCHGRNAISWAEKFKLDVWYVDHCTLWTDIKIIFITIKKVLFRDDINNADAATMFPFNGNN